MLSAADLQREAEAAGFRVEALEKVVRLLELLEGVRSHPFLKHRVALKGGTALNLFVFDVPRLSVDIDLNYTGSAERDVMLAERPKVEQGIQAVCGRAGMQIKRVPGEHAGGKWRLSYPSASGRSGTLEVDVNFLLRVPLWPTVRADSRRIGAFGAAGIPLLDLHELAAGKLAALQECVQRPDLVESAVRRRVRIVVTGIVDVLLCKLEGDLDPTLQRPCAREPASCASV